MNILKKSFDYIAIIVSSLIMCWYGIYYYSIPNKTLMSAMICAIVIMCLNLKQIRFDLTFCFLMETFFVKAVLDQQTGKADIVPTTMAVPMLVYLFGKLFASLSDKHGARNNKSRETFALMGLGMLSIGTTIHGLLNYRASKNLELIKMDYYTEFKDISIVVEKLTYQFNYSFLLAFFIALVVALIFYFAKKNSKINILAKIAVFAAAVVVIIKFIAYYTKTTRYLALLEGIHLITTKHWGNFGLDLTYKNSTSNMWLDYGRDYGILVFGTLFIFFIFTIKDLILLLFNKSVSVFMKTLLVCAFVLTNVYYFIDSRAYLYPCYWYVGLIICGIISEFSHMSTEE